VCENNKKKKEQEGFPGAAGRKQDQAKRNKTTYGNQSNINNQHLERGTREQQKKMKSI
jgi:hypothetical protein